MRATLSPHPDPNTVVRIRVARIAPVQGGQAADAVPVGDRHVAGKTLSYHLLVTATVVAE